MTTQFLNPVNTQTWSNGRHVVRCTQAIQETWDVRTFCFVAEQPILFYFKPGQFVTLELEIDGEQIMRSYSISSSPSVPYSFSITVKRIPGGKVSNWLHDNLVEGFELAVHGPIGDFNAIDYPTENILMLSGGVGITPVMSMARWFFDTNANVNACFIHSARTPRDVIFSRELDHMCSRIASFNVHVICERQEPGQPWVGYRGYLNQQMLELIAPDFMNFEVFCCGPPPYMRAVRRILGEAGFDMARYHEESFGSTPAEVVEDVIEHAEAAAEALDQADLVSVTFADSDKHVRVPRGETVHAAAAKVGLHIPKACGMGLCGTCRVELKAGTVDMQHNGGITEEDQEAGFILACCSRPLGDVVVGY